MAAEGIGNVLADVANYTSIAPVLQTSEIVDLTVRRSRMFDIDELRVECQAVRGRSGTASPWPVISWSACSAAPDEVR